MRKCVVYLNNGVFSLTKILYSITWMNDKKCRQS
jgi:hypothetical protein